MSDLQETPVVEPQAAPVKSRRRAGWIVGLSLLAVLLVGAAFLGGRLLNGQAGSGPGLEGLPAGGMGPGMKSIQIKAGEPPEQLPKTAADVTGQFVARNDNVLTLASTAGGMKGGGVVKMTNKDGDGAEIGPSTNPPVMPTPDGPRVEVVVTRDTKIYRDSTLDDLKGELPDGSTTLQQKATDATLDEISSTSLVTVWGRKSGDRVIADVIYFTSPVIFMKKK